mmetsp:Transcript_8907/g.12986  ORF Transcript_8907/g.12986 Transcript_8907/m.12986 type:complete len:113 (+) Transcript_8907:99-437(+)
MYTKHLDWCFSSFKKEQGSVLSTFHFYQRYQKRMRKRYCQFAHRTQYQFARHLLYCALMQLDVCNVCEHKHCALNCCDSMCEADAELHFILCPACIRKLQLVGVIRNVPEFL